MKATILGVLFFVAVAIAYPSHSNVYLDIYTNILSKQRSRIYNGKDANFGQFPHQASLRWGIFGLQTHICGGSCIASRTVLTAGHCKAYNWGDYDVVLGQLEQGDEDAQIYKIKEFTVHPKYPGGNAVAAYDVAIINLASVVKYGETIAAIKVAFDNCDVGGKELTISGFGYTSSLPFPPSHLKYDEVKGINNDECGQALMELLGEIGPLDDSMVCCISYHSKYQGTCGGDSGGPLTSDGKLVGITSWGIHPCGTAGAPSVFTSPCAHADFIKEHTLD